MSVILGIDTGGTFTDSVIIDAASRRILHKAKAYTTKNNLLHGIVKSLEHLHFSQPDAISTVCLSTTLATNAVVEGRGGRVGLLYMGRPLDAQAVPAHKLHQIAGQLDIKGREKEPMQSAEIESIAASWRGQIDAVAISGFASVRNPAHELEVKASVQRILSIPVVCAHELSTSLGFFDRTVTAVLNAALIPNITHLIAAVQRALKERNIHAPCMVVRGDGTLMLDQFALNRPIETVLSGPAASISGGLFLTQSKDALIIDMGGTTTDIANVTKGQISLSDSGATVGGWKTQLRAAEISTHGIGGDSYIQWNIKGDIVVGPQRVIPLCLAGTENPNLIAEWETYLPSYSHEIFTGQAVDCYTLLQPSEQADYEEQKLTSLLRDGPHTRFYLSEKMGHDFDKLDFDSYVSRGVLQRCSLTPTDLLHAAGRVHGNSKTSAAALGILAKRAAQTPDSFLQSCLDAVHRQLQIACLQSTADFEHSTFNFYHPSIRFLLDSDHPILRSQLSLKKPIVAIGAPVAAWFPTVSQSLDTDLTIPEHAEVANAIGAAVGQVLLTAEALIRPDQYHKGFIVHSVRGATWFPNLQDAEKWAIQTVETEAAAKATLAGGGNCAVGHSIIPTYTQSVGSEEKTFIQSKIVATAIGSPQWT